MIRHRIIPVLLIQNGGLVKSVRFKKYQYIGDPINAVKIFNEKEVDEIVLLNISASKNKTEPDLRQIKEIAGEAFMPLSYGGGITTIKQVQSILFSGIEKVILNKTVHQNPSLVEEIAKRYGSQSAIISIDIKKNIWGHYRVFIQNGTINTQLEPISFAKHCESLGAGEIIINSIDRDGTYKGYDLEITKQISNSVNIPVVACGGAGSLNDLKQAIRFGKASAVAAGSMFVFQRPHNAVLISYPSQNDITHAMR